MPNGSQIVAPDIVPRWASLAPWAAGTAYGPGERVTINNYIYEVYPGTVGGTSSSSFPAATLGPTWSSGENMDGTCLWTYVTAMPGSVSNWTAQNYPTANTIVADPNNTSNYWITAAGGNDASATGTFPTLPTPGTPWTFTGSAVIWVALPAWTNLNGAGYNYAAGTHGTYVYNSGNIYEFAGKLINVPASATGPVVLDGTYPHNIEWSQIGELAPTWDSSGPSAYHVGDVVTYNNATYYCFQAGSGNSIDPPNGAGSAVYGDGYGWAWVDFTHGTYTQPTEGESDVGSVPGTPAYAQKMNWLFYYIYRWLLWVQDLANQAMVWTAEHTFWAPATFDAGIIVNQSGANGNAVLATGNTPGSGNGGDGVRGIAGEGASGAKKGNGVVGYGDNTAILNGTYPPHGVGVVGIGAGGDASANGNGTPTPDGVLGAAGPSGNGGSFFGATDGSGVAGFGGLHGGLFAGGSAGPKTMGTTHDGVQGTGGGSGNGGTFAGGSTSGFGLVGIGGAGQPAPESYQDWTQGSGVPLRTLLNSASGNLLWICTTSGTTGQASPQPTALNSSSSASYTDGNAVWTLVGVCPPSSGIQAIGASGSHGVFGLGIDSGNGGIFMGGATGVGGQFAGGSAAFTTQGRAVDGVQGTGGTGSVGGYGVLGQGGNATDGSGTDGVHGIGPNATTSSGKGGGAGVYGKGGNGDGSGSGGNGVNGYGGTGGASGSLNAGAGVYGLGGVDGAGAGAEGVVGVGAVATTLGKTSGPGVVGTGGTGLGGTGATGGTGVVGIGGSGTADSALTAGAGGSFTGANGIVLTSGNGGNGGTGATFTGGYGYGNVNGSGNGGNGGYGATFIGGSGGVAGPGHSFGVYAPAIRLMSQTAPGTTPQVGDMYASDTDVYIYVSTGWKTISSIP